MGMKYEHPITHGMTRADLHAKADAAGVPMNAQLSVQVTRRDRPFDSDSVQLVWSWEIDTPHTDAGQLGVSPDLNDPQVIQTLLLLVDGFKMPTLEEIRGWNQATRRTVGEWAALTHLAASDNPVQVPDMPAVLDRWDPPEPAGRMV